MKKLLVSILALCIIPVSAAQISVRVYEADGETPFDGNDVMVGSKLTIVVSSDCNDYWSGGLFLAGQDRAFATLSGRVLGPNTRDWTGSHYENSGDFAKVTEWKDSSIWGFDLYTFYPVDGNSVDNSTVAGDWFIIDYEANEVGDCNLGFYDYNDYNISWVNPNYYITFSHSPTRDLNSDEVVNFGDFAILASQWNATDCNDPNWCDGTDLDMNGEVDCNDLGLFTQYWLWPSSDTEPGEEPNYPEDPNVIYSIVDVNGVNDITMDVGDSITLYVDMAIIDANFYDVRVFDVEVNISNPNLGSIDNTEYPSGTAQILAEPRDSEYDYWGPGIHQEEGIQLYGASISSGPMSSGHLASFVFTCDGQGDVTLELINQRYPYPKLESITIHQTDPNSQQMMGGGTGEMSGMQEMQQSEPTQEIDIDEIVSRLEEIWLEYDGIRDVIDEDAWEEFIGSIKSSAQQLP